MVSTFFFWQGSRVVLANNVEYRSLLETSGSKYDVMIKKLWPVYFDILLKRESKEDA